MRTMYILLIYFVSIPLNAHVYELLAPVDEVCADPKYESVCDGIVYIWTKCDVLRAINTREGDRQSFSQLIVADVMHVANNALKLLRYDDEMSLEQKQHLYALTDHLATAYHDAFADSDNTSITCTHHILSLLKEVTGVNTQT